jgi:sporulation protein YlmC with PRC-barrel domain
MSKTTMATAFAVAMAAGMAMASAQTAKPPPPSPTMRTKMTTNHLLPGQIRATEMTGAAVYDTQNQKIGSIKDIILDPDGRVAVVVLNVSGTLGVGGRYVAVGIGDLKITNTDATPRFTVDMLKDQLKTAQTYDLNEVKLPGAPVPPPPADDRNPRADPER